MIFFIADFFGRAFDHAQNLFYNYYYNNDNIYIDLKTPIPTIFGNKEEDSCEESNNNDYSSRISTPDIYDEYEFND